MISPLPSYIDIAAGPTRRSRRKLTTYEEADSSAYMFMKGVALQSSSCLLYA